MDGKSLNITEEKLHKLKEIIPEAFSENKIDWEKLKAALGDDIEFKNERYVLNWAGKSDAFRVLQSPTTATLAACKEESVNFDNTENIFIEGENLQVLKILQKSYFGKIKMIYIDPPYNTGNDNFIYPDKFSETKEEYLSRIGDKDETGFMTREGLFRKNSKDSGHYHSNWLSMMYPRLFLARNLLRDDGVIFVSIDDNEVHNLRLLMNEMYGEENFIAVFPWRKRTAKSDVPFGISQDFEWIIAYAKRAFEGGRLIERKYHHSDDYPIGWRLSDLTTQRSKEERPNSFFTMINPKNGDKYPANPNRVWGVTKDTFPEYYKRGKIVFPKDYDFLNISIPAYRVFETEDKEKSFKKYGTEQNRSPVSTLLPSDIGRTEDGTKEIDELFEKKVFPFSKPSSLIKFLCNIDVEDDGIILDFFSGSCTTAHAVLSLNKEDGGSRKFICVQLPEKCDENSEAYKAGYKTIAEIGKERIRRVIRTLSPGPSPLTGKGENGIQQNLFEHSANPAALSERGVFKYNPKLTERARELRKNSTQTEKKIWDGFLKDRPGGYKFLRQKPIGNYILDFYCSELLLAVEIDGDIHETRKEYDAERDNFLNKCGIKVIRVSNTDVENNFETVKQNIMALVSSASLNSDLPLSWGIDSDFPLSRGIDSDFPLSRGTVTDLPLSRGTEGVRVGFKVFKLRESNFKIWRSKIDNEAQLVEQLQQHLEPLDENARTEDVLFELLLKSGISLTAKIEEKDGCFIVNENEIALILDKVDKNIIKKVIELAPRKVITLDRLFNKNDQLKTNTALQMKDAGIEFKAV